jgi:hypothetical protein
MVDLRILVSNFVVALSLQFAIYCGIK